MLSTLLFVSCPEPVVTTASPTITPDAGTYVGTREVTILSDSDGTTIRYTLDGSDPTESSGTVYNKPIAITTNTTLKAIAVKTGFISSDVATATYTILPYGKQPSVDGSSGGFIFYDKGFYSDGWRYLEAAPHTWSGGAEDPVSQWGAWDYGVSAVGGVGGVATAKGVGAGKTNTFNIVNYHDNLGGVVESGKNSYYTHPTEYHEKNDGTVAAKICADYSVIIEGTVFDDWFLPSFNELVLMDINLHDQTTPLGGFPAKEPYWSSSEATDQHGSTSKFNAERGVYSKLYSLKIRPVRSF